MAQTSKVRDYMTADLVTFSPGMDIHQAIKLLVQNRISGAPVIDETNQLVGILSKKDCLKVAFSASYHQELGGRVSDYMSEKVETLDADTNIIEGAERFLNSVYRRFPVMDNGRLVGQISRHDILKAIEELW